ncbi:MAG: DUF2846 domain-containing protein [Nitrospirae bacterium]|nr:MAG: DUF2846 domain-containing protein [Nitrospirota bacterium]
MKNRVSGVATVLIVLAAVFAAAGCAPTLQQVYQRVEAIPPGKALVYIYRPGGFLGGAVYYDVRANGTVVTTLYRGGYYPYIAEPAEIEFSAKTEATDSVTIDVKAGQTYYIKGTVGVGFVVGRPHLTVVPASDAESEIAECKLLPGPEKQESK